MIRRGDRQTLVRDINQACAEGGHVVRACMVAGIDIRTLQRWLESALASERRGDNASNAEFTLCISVTRLCVSICTRTAAGIVPNALYFASQPE
jgi:hypothetical protein